jgi:hypothetical protein
MAAFDFNNNRGQNLSDPKFDKDAVNFRTLKELTSVATANTLSNVLIKDVKISLNATQIQNGNTSPIDSGIPLPGTSEAIEVVSASINFTANTTPFLSSNIFLITDTLVDPQVTGVPILDGGSDAFVRFAISTTTVSSMAENKKLLIQTDSDSVGTGDGEARLYITYRIITV